MKQFRHGFTNCVLLWYVLAGLLKASNRRYLEFISTYDDPSQEVKHLNRISKTVKLENRPYNGFNFYCADDQKLFEILVRGEFNINGLYNKSLRVHFPDKSRSAISRILKRLRVMALLNVLPIRINTNRRNLARLLFQQA